MAEQIDIASRFVSGAFFVLSPRAGAFSSDMLDEALKPRSEDGTPQSSDGLVWTREGYRSTLKDALLVMIRNAKRKIFIASFRFGDDELFEELFAAVDRLRGSVYVITLLDEQSLARGLAEADDDDAGDKQALAKRFGPLVERGLYVRGHDSCHAKFIVVDDEIALVSSANLESSAFTRTTEVGVIVREKAEVLRVARLYARLWHECTWEVAPGGAYTVAKRGKTPPSFTTIPQPASRQCALWTHGSVHSILKASRDTILAAERDLLLASFSLEGMADKRDLLLTAVERFRKEKRGRVRLLVRARNHLPSHRRDAAEFAELGCTVLADGVNHAKCVIADGKEAVLFSANFDAKHGLTSGVEAGVRLVEPRLVRGATTFFEMLLRAAPMKLELSPSHRTLQMLAASWARPWPDGSPVNVRVSDADWKALTSLEPGLPVLFEQGTDGRTTLFAGRNVLFLEGSTGTSPARIERGPAGGVDSAATLETWMVAKTPGAWARGFCAATFVRV
ncbi:MAG: phospholipase D-like domain-containing protein [Byssovorax sp.]